MAGSDSLLGGELTLKLSDSTKNLINEVLKDTVDGVVITKQVGSGTLITGIGEGGAPQGVLVSSNGSAITGEVVSGKLSLSVQLPPGMGAAFQGLDAKPAAEATAYINSIVDQYLPAASTDPDVITYRTNLLASIATLKDSLGASGFTSVSVRFIAFSSDGGALPGIGGVGARATASNEVVLDLSASSSLNGSSAELLSLMLGTIGAGKTLVLKGVEAAMLIGSGTVRVDDLKGAFLMGDLANQNMTGGIGRDTLVGGGGNDTLTGGGGADVFGLNAFSGKTTITDFQIGIDKLGFGVAGVKSANDLASHFKGITESTTGVTLNFDNNTSITLVGVTASQLTLDMLTFTL